MQLEFQKTARDFARKELLPHASEWDENKQFPVETLRAAAQLGFGGLYIRWKLCQRAPSLRPCSICSLLSGCVIWSMLLSLVISQLNVEWAL